MSYDCRTTRNLIFSNPCQPLISGHLQGVYLSNDFIVGNYKTAYDILSLKHQQGKTYKKVVQQYNIRITYIVQTYRNFYILIMFYHYSLKTTKRKPTIREIHDLYYIPEFIVTYYEKMYKQELNILRNGESPLILDSHDFPDYRNLSDDEILKFEKIILKVIRRQHRKFTDIAKKLDIIKEKTLKIYRQYFNKKVI